MNAKQVVSSLILAGTVMFLCGATGKKMGSVKKEDFGKAEGRSVTLEMALSAIDEALRLLETKADLLTAKYAITRS